jgi:hypothetical protein
LVDEAGATQNAIPAQRKIATMTPRVLGVAHLREDRYARVPRTKFSIQACLDVTSDDLQARRVSWHRGAASPRNPLIDLRSTIGVVDWSLNPAALRRGELSGLPEWVADLLRRAAEVPLVVALSADLGIAPLVVAVALLARADAASNRSAARLQRAVLRGASEQKLDAATSAMGL